MKTIVFGGSGFLGSHVADQLSELGHNVTVFDKNESPYLQASQQMIKGNILDKDTVVSAIKGHDVVFNFAGEAAIARATSDPLSSIEANVMGNANILEACRLNSVKRYIFASTVYVYSAVGSFYRASKQSCELFIECYHEQYGLDYTILRYGSLYGPRADDTNFINNIVKQALKNKKVIRKGDGDEIREYIHVKDAAQLTTQMLEEQYANQYFILTGEKDTRIRDVLTMLKEMMGNSIEIEYSSGEDEGHYEVTPYNFQPKFARKLTSNMHVDFGQGLLELLNIEHEKEHKKPKEMERV